MTFRNGLLALALLLSLTAGGCGQQGPLYLPDKARDIITRPTQTPPQPPTPDEEKEASNSPQTVDSPVASPPAPEVTAPEPAPPDEDEKKNGTPPPK